MPFEDVKLVFNTTSNSIPQSSIRLMDQATSYLRSRENLNFYFLSDFPSSTTPLADGLKQNPEFTLSGLQLVLECKGLAIDNKSNKRPTLTFHVSIPPETCGKN